MSAPKMTMTSSIGKGTGIFLANRSLMWILTTARMVTQMMEMIMDGTWMSGILWAKN